MNKDVIEPKFEPINDLEKATYLQEILNMRPLK